MPKKAKKSCAEKYCSNLISEGRYCEVHKRKGEREPTNPHMRQEDFVRAKMPCAEKFCPNLVSEGRYCDVHKREKENNYEREAYRSVYTTTKWRVKRAIFLKQNPLCVMCLKNNVFTPATEIDHIIPHRGEFRLLWNRENWQALCKHHHSSKTAKEDGGYGNAKRVSEDAEKEDTYSNPFA